MRVRHIGLVAAFALAGCGGDSDPPEREAATATAAAPTATTVPMTETDAPVPERQRFRTVAQAVAAVQKLVKVPVVVPRGLPGRVRVVGAGGSPRSNGYIALHLERRRVLHIQYGRAGFDGCGPLNPRATRVGGVPAVINASGHGVQHVTLVWPATVKKPTGRYGLSGRFSEDRMRDWAESMQRRAQVAGRGRHKPGC